MKFKFDCTLFWVFDKHVNDLSQKYQMDLCHLSDKVVEKLTDAGVNVKVCAKPEDQNRGYYVTVKSINPLRIANVPEDSTIGNGTKARVVVTTYNWTYQKREGVSLSLYECAVTDLVEYSRDSSDIVEID